MFGLGMSEIIVLAVIGLIVIGPKELPELARTLGRFINDLKRSTDGLTEDFKNQIRLEKFDNYTNIHHNESSSQSHDLPESPQDYVPHEEQPFSNDGHHTAHAELHEPEQLELSEQTPDNTPDKEIKKS